MPHPEMRESPTASQAEGLRAKNKSKDIVAETSSEIKREFLQLDKPDIIAILQKENIDLHQKGRYFWARCPLRSEKTASFKIDPDKQSYHCFGCHASGDSIALIMALHSLSFKEALAYLGLSATTPTFNRAQLQRAAEDRALKAAFNQDCKRIANNLYDLLRRLDGLRMKVQSMTDAERMAHWLHREPIWEYWISILEGRDEQAKYEIWQGVQHGRI